MAINDIEGFVTRLGLPVAELIVVALFVWKVLWPWMTRQVDRLNSIVETSIKAMTDTSHALTALSDEIKLQSTAELSRDVKLLAEMLDNHDTSVRRDFDEIKRKLDNRPGVR